MIPILYDHDETDFTSQGICRLYDAVDCVVTEEVNGIYECELKYPIDGDFFDEIIEGRLIGATHDDNSDIQPFEIYKYSAPIDGIVTFYAHHISYRLANNILTPFHASSCTEAMSMMAAKSMNRCPFSFWTNVGTTGSFDVNYPISIKEMLAGNEKSIMNVYGPGEFEFDKWTVKFHEDRGVDHGVEIHYGKNMTSITRDYDSSGTYTAVVPYWYKEDSDGTPHLVVLDDFGVIVSESDAVQHVFWTDEHGEIIRNEHGFPIEFDSANMIYAPLDLSSEFEEAPTQEELALAAKYIFDAAAPWIPEDSIKVSFVSLWQTPEYENYAPLEKVSLCDYVRVVHSKLGIYTLAKVTKTAYNVLLDRYNSVELGVASPSYADQILGDTQTALEKIQHQLQHTATADYVNEQIGSATNKITGGLGGYVKVTLNADGEPQEILIMDHPSTETAVNVIRINQAGIGFSQNGYQGPFNSAWLIDGTFDAQVINVVNLAATVIRTGFLTDAKGYNYWNLETGEFRLSSTAMLDTYKETSYTATRDYKIGDKVEVQLQNDTFIYEVTSVIPEGTTIRPGVNVKSATAHTLAEFARRAEAIADVDVEYARHTSPSDPPAKDSPLWSTESPTWTQGEYIWQRTKMRDGNNETHYSEPVCIQGAKGETGSSGVNGQSSTVLYLYKRSATEPSKPSSNCEYSFKTHALTPIPTGWNQEYVDGLDPLYAMTYTAVSDDPEGTVTILGSQWSTPVVLVKNGSKGSSGKNTAVVHLYKRSTTPVTSIDWNYTLKYSFTENKLIQNESNPAVPNGWFESIVDAGQDGDLYVTAATVSSANSTVTIPATNTWVAPVCAAKNGTNGLSWSSAAVFLYARAANASSLRKPKKNLTYTFSTGLLSRGGQTGTDVLEGWSQTIPAANGNPCYVIQAVAVSDDGQTDTILGTNDTSGGDWSNILLLVTDGENGLNTATVFLYARAADVSDLSAPSEVLYYDFSTSKLYEKVNNTYREWTSSTWSLSIPASDGNPCFMTLASAASTEAKDAIATSEWQAIRKIVEDGADGEQGDPGIGVDNIEEQYCLSPLNDPSHPPTTGWQGTQPTWEKGWYIWTRSKITWTDIDETTGQKRITYTDPVLANAVNGANEAVENLDDSLEQDEIFRRLTNNLNTEGVFLENGRLYLNATALAAGIIHDKGTIGGSAINVDSEDSFRASRDYTNGSYISVNGTIYKTTDSVLKGNPLSSSNISANCTKELSQLYSEVSKVATRAYSVNDYVRVGSVVYKVINSIPAGGNIVVSGSSDPGWPNVQQAYTNVYAEDSLVVSQWYFGSAYIAVGNELYHSTTGLNPGDRLNIYLLSPNISSSPTSLGSLYQNYWNLNTGYFQTLRGMIAGFNIGSSKWNNSIFATLFYMSPAGFRNNVYDWNYPYSAVNTPVQGVALRGNPSDTDTGFSIISQGRMYVDGTSTNFAGRLRINAGMLYFEVGLTPSDINSYWSTLASITPFSGTNMSGLRLSGSLVLNGKLGSQLNPDSAGTGRLTVNSNLLLEGKLLGSYTGITGSPLLCLSSPTYCAEGLIVDTSGGKPKSGLVNTESYGNRLLYSYEMPSPCFGDFGEGVIGEDGSCYIWLDPIFSQTIEHTQYQIFLQAYDNGECYIFERNSSYFIVKGTPNLAFGWELKAKQLSASNTRLGIFEMYNQTMPTNDNFIQQENEYLKTLREGRVTQ